MTRPASRRLGARLAPLLLAAGAAWLAPACESETIVLATVPDTDSGVPRTSTRCASPSDCPAGSYCVKTACGDAAGTCDLVPGGCTGDLEPVCGCDRVTYFNDCLRRAAGVEASSPGRCPFDPRYTCGDPNDPPCAEGAFCARLLGLRDRLCPRDPVGTCWVVPFHCPPPDPRADPWVPCGSPGARCVDVCTAIRSELPHRLADACP